MGKSVQTSFQKWSSAAFLAAMACGAFAASANAGPQGSPVANLVYTSLEPCRVVDTRTSGAGAMLKDETRSLDIVGVADLTLQGSTAWSGCGIPGFDKRGPRTQAIALQITVLDATGAGDLTVWGADRRRPEIPTLSFGAESRSSTLSSVIQVRQDLQGQDLQLHSTQPADVLVDVVGFYSKLRPTDFLPPRTKLGKPRASGEKAAGTRGTDETVTGNLYVLGIAGIGTNNPNAQLEVSGLTGPTGVPKIAFRNQVAATGFASAVQFGAGGGTLSSFNVPSDILAFVNQVSPMKGGLAIRTNRGNSVLEAMRVEENGRVGIGTTAPTSPLHVSSGGTATIRLESTGQGGNPVLEIKDGTALNRNSAINFLDSANNVPGQVAYQMPSGPMVFRVNNNTELAISSAGGLIAGDTTPTAGQAFHSFGTGTKDEPQISSLNDVYISQGLELDGILYTSGGSAAAPAIAFGGDTDTGIFRPTAKSLAVTTEAAERFRVNNTSVRQPLANSGLVKAAAHILLTGTTATVSREFNNLPSAAAITVSRLSIGNYQVNFGDNVHTRFYQATIGLSAVGAPTQGQIVVGPGSTSVNALLVRTADSAGTLIDNSFFIVVY